MSVPAGASRLNAPGVIVEVEVAVKAARSATSSLMAAGGLVRDFDWYRVEGSSYIYIVVSKPAIANLPHIHHQSATSLPWPTTG